MNDMNEVLASVQAMADELEATRARADMLQRKLRQEESHLVSERFSNGLVREQLDASTEMVRTQNERIAELERELRMQRGLALHVREELDASRNMVRRQTQAIQQRDDEIAELEERLMWVRSNVPAKFMMMNEDDGVYSDSFDRHDDTIWERMRKGLMELTTEYQVMYRKLSDK